jgi:hypothetical protein
MYRLLPCSCWRWVLLQREDEDEEELLVPAMVAWRASQEDEPGGEREVVRW